MAWSKERLEQIFKRSSGKCHICHEQLEFLNHGKQSKKGGWHVEHSVPRAKGGTDRLNNLFPAHVKCNLDKGVSSTPSARSKHGKKRAPLSVSKRSEAKIKNGFWSGGGVALAAMFLRVNPVVGVVVTAVIAISSYIKDPDDV